MKARLSRVASLPFESERRQRVALASDGVQIGAHVIDLGARLDLGPPLGVVSAQRVKQAAEAYQQLTGGECQPQLAALIYDSTRQPRALDHYFPLTRRLSAAAREAFDELVQHIASHPHFDVQLIGERMVTLTPRLPASARGLVAGHLAETFFFRRDILARFLSAPRHFQLYTTGRAYRQDGGAAGGQYHSERQAVQLVLQRLWEGFYEVTPGVAPFLHEFGHMLDFFDAGTGEMQPVSEGLLPGLHPRDGAVYTPQAREWFIIGKRLELERYQARLKASASDQNAAGSADLLPIGHPYVFQNDAEFCAGYFEMFFRNPHYMAGQNPTLFSAYVALFGYDPRPCWEQDFEFYIQTNRGFYLSGETPWPTHLTIPADTD